MMKQTSFMVEVVATKDQPTIIVRIPNGTIVKVTSNPDDLTSFLEDICNKLYKEPSKDSNYHE